MKPKLYIIFVFVQCFVITNTKGQSTLNQTIHKEFKNSSLISFLDFSSSNDSLKYFYDQSWLNNIIIQNSTTGNTIKSIINNEINSYGLSYIVFQNNKIIFIPEGFAIDQNKLEKGMVGYIKIIGNIMDKGKFKENKVDGYITFGKTGEPIVGAVIQDKKHKLATTSASDGYYSIFLPIGQTDLEFSFIGLETNIAKVNVLSPGKLDVELMETSITLEGVTVTSNKGMNQVNRTQMGVEALDMKSLKKLPVLMGEADIIKSMTLLPGVQSSGEMSSGFNVRGGNVDQNLVLLNEAPVYNASHLFGLFSAFIPGSINGVELYKGTQTADFGGRVASVMDINMKKADTAKIKVNAGIGILNSQVFVEGPIVKNFCSFFVGGRTTYSNWILKQVQDVKISNSKTQFYDFIGKLDFKFAPNHFMETFAYQSNDYFNYGSINEFDYTSKIAALNYKWIINPKSQFKAHVSFSGYISKLAEFEDTVQASRLTTGIEQLKSKLEYTLDIFNQHTTIGIEVNHYRINPGKKEPYGANSTSIAAKLDNEKAVEIAGFISDNYALTEKISLLIGFRYSLYSKIGPYKEFVYRYLSPLNDNTVVDSVFYNKGELAKPYHGLEPRLGLRIMLNNTSSVKIGYTYARQYQQLITNSSSTTPSDYWKSCDTHIKPLISQQYSVGYFTTLMDEHFDLSLETYYKENQNQIDYKNGAVLAMKKAIERDLISGFCRSYGIETMIRKSLGNLTGWLSYTLSNTQMKANGRFKEEKINDGEYYAASNHHLHDLSLTLNYQFSRRWNVASNFVYTSGRPSTYPEIEYVIQDIDVVRYSKRNKYRLPAYHRLDLSATYEGNLSKKHKVHPSLTFAVYNVYAHKNIYSVYYKKDTPSSKNNFHSFALYQLSIIGVPIPSITLNLNF